jgi:AraC family transcriptional regulator of adaptative response/methylated-DNA-[protein]-cysteine methyltransferase
MIAKHVEDPVSISQLATELQMSPYHFQRIFKKIIGITPKQYEQACRSSAVKQRLRDGESIVDAVYASGYGSSSRLYEKANRQFGMTPSEYKHGGLGLRIHYAIVNCFLGRLFVATTEKGICGVRIGSSDEELLRSFKSEFRFAEIQKNSQSLTESVEIILEHLKGQSPHLKLPLDIQGTAFQWRVWQELQKIPYGATRSYRQIAAKLGQPTAVRAVARACAKNPVAIVVPCHRVVRHDGSLGGYRWGIERKRALLNRENQIRKKNERAGKNHSTRASSR